MRILLVEDDPRVANFIRRGLKEEGFAVDVAPDGENGLDLALTDKYDLIILDLVLPRKDGLEVLKEVRRENRKVPVLILTAKDELDDKVAGLNTGADDYLTKPFGFEELLARVRALLRRGQETEPARLKVADLEMDLLRHRVWRSGREIPLTHREYALLEFLMRKRGEVVTRTMLSEHVWEMDFDPGSNVIDVHIARLRRKVDRGFPSPLITTLRSRGYMLGAPEES